MSKSYKEIFRSTGIIALVQIFQMVFGLIRNKVLALLLGTSGFGIWGLYDTYVNMITSFSVLGLDQSGVRQIASTASDETTVGKCIWVFRRGMLFFALIATTLSILFAKPISRSLFKSDDYYGGVIIVSFFALFSAIHKANYAILNGFRKIKELAISQIICSFLGAVVAVSFVLLMGIDGIPFFVLMIPFTASIVTWMYVRKLQIAKIKPTASEIKQEMKEMLSLGIGFSVTSAFSLLMSYLAKIYLVAHYNLEAVGIYQACWTISNLYIGTILTAMGVDFMPRLMRVIGDKAEVQRMVKEQLEFGVLLSGIGVIAIIVFAPLVLKLLYTSEFVAGATIIRWQVLGVALRIFGFVFGYTLMAYKKVNLFITSQLTVFTLDLVLLIIFSELFGFNYLGINYFLSYLIYVIITYLIIMRKISIRFSASIYKLCTLEWAVIVLTFLLSRYLSSLQLYVVGTFIMALYVLYVVHFLKSKMGIDLVKLILKR